jgi:twitching motility two-component system response regulator PilG
MLDRMKGRLAGAKEYLVKPFKTRDVVAVARKYVGSYGEGDSN